jgi:hypothetical protein
VSPAGAVPARFLDLQCASRENIGEAIRSRGAAVPRFRPAHGAGGQTGPADYRSISFDRPHFNHEILTKLPSQRVRTALSD